MLLKHLAEKETAKAEDLIRHATMGAFKTFDELYS
jgi:hypothetical protein